MSSLPSLSQIQVDKDTFTAYILMMSSGAKVDPIEEKSIKLSFDRLEVDEGL